MMRKPKTSRQKIILANDALIRKIILLRDNSTCQKTGKKENPQVCHFYSRSNLRVRFDEDNLCVLNAGIHLYFAHKYPQAFRDFWLKRLGQKKFDMLEIKARYVTPIKEHDLLFIQYSLKKRLRELENLPKI